MGRVKNINQWSRYWLFPKGLNIVKVKILKRVSYRERDWKMKLENWDFRSGTASSSSSNFQGSAMGEGN